MTFPVLGIPNATDVPSQSQSQIQTNFNSIIGWGSVDHIGYGSTNAGQHAQINLPANNVPGSPPSSLASVAYSNAGVAASSASQLWFQNSLGSFLLSGIRAYGFCSASGIVSGQSFNVSSISHTGTGQFAVTLTSNAVSSSNFGVLVSSTMNGPPWTGGVLPGYVITGTGAFTLNFHALIGNNGVDPTNYTFIVFQI